MIKPKKSLGQHFLTSEGAVSTIIDTSEVAGDDIILEIGPGIGNLTKLLCDRALNQSSSDSSGSGQAGFVLSIEKDPKFFPILKSIKKDYPDNFRFEIADALEFNFENFFQEQGYKL